MNHDEYLKRARILGHRAELLEKAGRKRQAEKANMEIQELDFEVYPDLAGSRPAPEKNG